MLHIPIDCGGHEHQVGAQKLPDQWEGDGRRLVNTHQLSLLQLVAVTRMNVLGREGEIVPVNVTSTNPPLLHN